MARIGYWHCVGLCGLAAFSLSAMAQGQPIGDPSPKWRPHIDVEAKPGSKRTLGEADLFIPLSQDADTLIFGSLRGRFDDQTSSEGNFGLGLRHMLTNGWNLGAYGYFDRRRTDQGNFFNQSTLGFEALGRDWDLRTNVYQPLGDRVRDLGTTGGGSTAALSGSTVQVTTAASTTREERALGGYDAEVGWRLPLFDAEDRSQLRLYLGSYRFSDDVANVTGSRLRLEFTLAQVPHLWRGAELSLGAEGQDDNVRGSQTFVSLRLRIPLGGKAEQARPLSAQERRMTAPIVRDVDIVALNRVAASTAQVVETATQTSSGQTLTVLSSATTTGAALPGAITTAGANSTVILSGTFNTTGITTLQSGQTVMGAGSLTVRTASGRNATLTTSSATLNGNVGASNYTVEMASNSTLRGLTINSSNTGGNSVVGVRAQNVTGVTIANNTITASSNTASSQAVLVSIGGAGNSASATISNNTLTATTTGSTSAYAIQVNDFFATSNVSATISGNTLSASGASTTNAHTRLSGANILTGSSGNTVTNGTCSVASAGSGGTVTYTNAAACGP